TPWCRSRCCPACTSLLPRRSWGWRPPVPCSWVATSRRLRMIPTPVPLEEQVRVAAPAAAPLPAAPPAAAPPKPVKRGRGLGWVMVAICAAGGGLLATAAYKYLHTLGNVIVIHFQDAQGLRPGSDLRYRGVAIGRVTDVRVRSDLGGV